MLEKASNGGDKDRMGEAADNGGAKAVQFRTLTNGAGAANVGWEQGQDQETHEHYNHFNERWKEYFFSMANRSSTTVGEPGSPQTVHIPIPNGVLSGVEELGKWKNIFSSSAGNGKTGGDVSGRNLYEVGEDVGAPEDEVKNGIYVHRGCQFGGFVENFWHWFFELIVPFYIHKRAMGWVRMLVVWYGYAHLDLQIWRDDKLDESLILTELQYRAAADLGIYFEISKAGPDSLKNHLKQNRVCVTSKKAGDNVGLPGPGVADFTGMFTHREC